MAASRKLGEARKLIMKGCELCPSSEDVWLEAARLQTPDHAKALLARGVAANPTSIKLWMQVWRPCPPGTLSWQSNRQSCYCLAPACSAGCTRSACAHAGTCGNAFVSVLPLLR